MTNRTRKWIRSGIEVLVHGGTAALISGIALALGDKDHYSIFTKAWWGMVGTIFAGNGGVRWLQWWQSNPLPPADDTTPPFAVTPQIGLSPLTKVQPIPLTVNDNAAALPPKQ